jgi:hypothetical protein
MQPSASCSWLARLTTALAFVLCLIVCARLVGLRIEYPWGFDGDESDHAMWGAAVYTDLTHGDLPAFLRHLYAQNRFPPLYSLLQLPFLAALGVTPLAHRLTASLWLLALFLTVYLCVAWGARRGRAWPGAVVAVLLAAGSPRLLAVATTVYYEPAGFALMMLTYAFYLRARGLTSCSRSSQEGGNRTEEKANGCRGAVWPAAACYLCLWFLKWQFGLLVGLVLVGHVLLANGFRWSRLRTDRVAWGTLLPAWVAMVLWLANPYQLREFLLYLTGVPKPSGFYQRFLEGYLMQGRFLFTAWSATLPAAVVALGGLIYGLGRLRHPVPLLYTLSALAALVVSANVRGGAEDRIMMWLLPPLWVLAGMGVNEGLAALARRGCWARPGCRVVGASPPGPLSLAGEEEQDAGGRGPGEASPPPLLPRASAPREGAGGEAQRGGAGNLALSALALGLLLLAAGNLAPALRQAGAEIAQPHMPSMWDLLGWVSTHVSPERRLVMVDCWGRGFPPNAVKWAYLARWGWEGLSYDDLHVWEWPALPEESHPLHLRGPWHARLPAPPPAPPPADTARLAAAGVNALLVCEPPGETPPAWKAELLQRAIQRLGFREVGEHTPGGDNYRLVAFLRLPSPGVIEEPRPRAPLAARL